MQSLRPLLIMAPSVPLHVRLERTPTINLLKCHEKPLTEDQLFLLLSKCQQHTKKCMPSEEEIDQWVEVSSSKPREQSSNRGSKKDSWNHSIFMYNFFHRRGSNKRAAKYLEKIENGKSEKIRARVSQIRNLDLGYISLPMETINLEDAKQRDKLKEKALAETAESKKGKDILNLFTNVYY